MARPTEDKNKPRGFFRRDFLEGATRAFTTVLLIGGARQILFEQVPVAVAQAASPDQDIIAQDFKDVVGVPDVNPSTLPALPFQPEYASLKRALVITNFGLNHGIKVEEADRDRLDLAIATLKDIRAQQGNIWKPVYVETHDNFRELPDFASSQRMRTPEVVNVLPDGQLVDNGGSQTYAYNDIIDTGDALRLRICFAGDQTEQVFSGSFFDGDQNADRRKAWASMDTSRLIASVLSFNTANTLRWPRTKDMNGISTLDFSPLATNLFTPPFTQIV